MGIRSSTAAAVGCGDAASSSFFSHRVALRSLRPGDHLYVWSSFLHHHHAIYIGTRDGVPSVIHVFGANKRQSEVRRDSLRVFAAGRVLRRARYGRPWWELYVKAPGTAYAFPCDDRSVIVRRAEAWLQSDVNARRTASAGSPDSESEWGHIMRRLVRENLITAAPSEGAVIRLEDAPWHYNLLRRNCECFCVLCTAPDKQNGSHQAQQLTRFNPLATLVAGMLARFQHYRTRSSSSSSWIARLVQSSFVAKRREAARRFQRRVRVRVAAWSRRRRLRRRTRVVERLAKLLKRTRWR